MPPSAPWFAPLYPEPPFEFRAAQQSWVVYDGVAADVASVLPPGVVVADDPPLCAAWACHYPVSSFGPYLEAYVVVRVRAAGELFWYQPVIVTDSEAPLAAGREVWGYPKKLAVIGWSGRSSGGPGTEQLVMTVQRPAGVRLMTFTLVPERLVDPRDPELAEALAVRPTLSHRLLPGVDELVAVDVRPRLHRGRRRTRRAVARARPRRARRHRRRPVAPAAAGPGPARVHRHDGLHAARGPCAQELSASTPRPEATRTPIAARAVAARPIAPSSVAAVPSC